MGTDTLPYFTLLFLLSLPKLKSQTRINLFSNIGLYSQHQRKTNLELSFLLLNKIEMNKSEI